MDQQPPPRHYGIDDSALCLNIVATIPPPRGGGGLAEAKNNNNKRQKPKGKWRRPQAQPTPCAKKPTTKITTNATTKTTMRGTGGEGRVTIITTPKDTSSTNTTNATTITKPSDNGGGGVKNDDNDNNNNDRHQHQCPAPTITKQQQRRHNNNSTTNETMATLTTTTTPTTAVTTSTQQPQQQQQHYYDEKNRNNQHKRKTQMATTTTNPRPPAEEEEEEDIIQGGTTTTMTTSRRKSQQQQQPQQQDGLQHQGKKSTNSNKRSRRDGFTITSSTSSAAVKSNTNNNKRKKEDHAVIINGSSSSSSKTKKDEDDEDEAKRQKIAERAAYLARYHAHPKELDRRHKTTTLRQVPPPAPSDHVFGGNNNKNNNHGSNNNYGTAAGDNATATMTTWQSLGISDFYQQRLVRLGYNIPTTIQARSCRLLASVAVAATGMTTTAARDDGHATDGDNHRRRRRRVMIHSETGSGKTLAYLLPILINAMPRQQLQQQANETTTIASPAAAAVTTTATTTTRLTLHLHCLIIVPTRELAYQIYTTAAALTAGTPLVAGVVVGAEKRTAEKARLRKGVPILIATLGRLMDHVQSTTTCDLTKVKTVVLDEVDRLLLDRPDVIATLLAGAVNLQSLIVVSATCDNPTVAKFCRENNGGRVVAEKGGGSSGSDNNDDDADDGNDNWQHVREANTAIAVPHQLQMLQLTVHAKYRFPALLALLGGSGDSTTTAATTSTAVPTSNHWGDTVVFCATCAAVDFYHALMTQPQQRTTTDKGNSNLVLLNDIDSMKLHGNMELADRTACLKRFRSSPAATSTASTRRKVLWTTDVAARGLNLSGTNSQRIRIVQYDPPTELSDYLHRAGRTARAGEAGTCLIFTLPTESQPFADLLRETTDNGNILLPISLNETLENAAKFFPNLQQNGGRVADAVCLEISRHFEQLVNQSDDLLEMARAAFLAHIRAYAVKEKALKSVFVARGLHLGHVARSFLLKEPPTSFSSGGARVLQMPKHKKKDSKRVEQNPLKAPSLGSKISQRKRSQLLFSNAAKLEATMDGM